MPHPTTGASLLGGRNAWEGHLFRPHRNKCQTGHNRCAAARPKLGHDQTIFGTMQELSAYFINSTKLNPGNTMNSLPVDRALRIYTSLADRPETKGARGLLSKHLMKKYIEGEKDEHRLTVEGLSYLQNLYREIDSRT
jgi:hypothetical protein